MPAQRGRGRPRKYCRRSCRQRDFEARRRALELGLAESDLIVARQAIEGLDDLCFVLGCAIADVEADITRDGSPEQLKASLQWLLEAARPLLGTGDRLRAASGGRVGAGQHPGGQAETTAGEGGAP